MNSKKIEFIRTTFPGDNFTAKNPKRFVGSQCCKPEIIMTHAPGQLISHCLKQFH